MLPGLQIDCVDDRAVLDDFQFVAGLGGWVAGPRGRGVVQDRGCDRHSVGFGVFLNNDYVFMGLTRS